DTPRGEVHASDLAAVLGREIARRATRSAADVEQAHRGHQLELLEQVSGRLPAADVELVGGGQVSVAEVLDVQPGGRYGVEESPRRPARSVMGRDSRVSIHDRQDTGGAPTQRRCRYR